MNVMSIVRRVGVPAALIGATVLAPTAAQAAAATPSQTSAAVSQPALPWQMIPNQVNDCSGYAVVTASVRGLVPGRHYSIVSDDSTDTYPSVEAQPAVPVVADRSGTIKALWANQQYSRGSNCAAGWFVIDTGKATVKQYVESGNPYRTVFRGATAVRYLRPDALCTVDGCRQALLSQDGRTSFPQVFTSRYTLIQQTDGNLVLRHDGKAIWSTGTAGNPGARFLLQSDGNLVLRSTSGKALWNSGTAKAGSARYLTLQDDGNLVLRDGGTQKAVWSSGTAGR